MRINRAMLQLHPMPTSMRDKALQDFAMLEEFLLPNAQEMMEISVPDEYDYLLDIPAYRDAVEDVMIHRGIDEDMNNHPSVYGA